MNERYTVAITRNPGAGEDMIYILIIDTMPTNGQSEILNKTVHKKDKIATLLPYMEQFGHDIKIVDASL